MNLFDSDILINLDGKFVIPRDGMKPIVGELNPDLRLQHLDAFVEQLNYVLGEHPNVAEELSGNFASVIRKAKSSMLDELDLKGRAECQLKIGCQIDPKNKNFTYTFTLSAKTP